LAIEITAETHTTLPTYGSVSIAFEVDRIYEVSTNDAGQLELTERKLEKPYRKDYDEIPGNKPINWSQCFDLTNWGFIVARENDRRVGGAAIAHNSADIHLLEGNEKLALLWDLRVSPDYRGRGLGLEIFQKLEEWCLSRGCTELKVETQSTNVSACNFYKRQGCELRAVNRFAYSDYPDEIQMLWYKSLS
jgi:GNAT superfamily N-acetyltransferase